MAKTLTGLGLTPSEACGNLSFSAVGTTYAASGVQGSSLRFDLPNIAHTMLEDWYGVS